RLGTVRFRHGFLVNTVAFAPDGKVLASAGGLGFGVCLWDAATGRPLHQLSVPRRVSSLAFSPDGKLLFTGDPLSLIDAATGNEDGAVCLWDVATGKELRALRGHDKSVTAVVFAPGGKVLASAGDDREARLWEVATGKPLRRLKGHEAEVFSVAFSPDGKL